jgi:K+-sensing histidine kinase KdpD
MLAREGEDRHVPTPFILAISSAILFSVVALVGPHRDLFSVSTRLALMSIAVAACAAFASLRAAVVIAALGWLFMTAFFVGRYGVLDWRGASDLMHLLALIAAALIAAHVRARLLVPRRPGGPSRSG